MRPVTHQPRQHTLIVPARYNFLYFPQGRPCGRPPSAAVLGRQDPDRASINVAACCRATDSLALKRIARSGDRHGRSPLQPIGLRGPRCHAEA
jgi:hypothetical protein